MSQLKEILPLEYRRIIGRFYQIILTIIKGIFLPNSYNRYCLLELIQQLIYPKRPLDDHGRYLFEDFEFNKIYAPFAKNESPRTLYRRYNLFQLTKLVKHLAGNTAECGVYQGVSSFLICSSLVGKERHHFGFDSFEGLSQPGTFDGGFWTKGDLSSTLDIAKRNLSPFATNLVLKKGWIPQCFTGVEDNKFCFVHLDVDLYQPTIDSLNFFYERMIQGGIIICDDSGFKTCPGARKAWNDFFKGKPEQSIELSSGQSFVVKR